MITKNRLLLVMTNKEMLYSFVGKFEAIQIISTTDMVETIWAKNKTPVILEEKLLQQPTAEYPTLKIPIEVIFCNDDLDEETSFIKYCHENGFECGEFDTGKIYNTANDDCFLCRIANLEGCNRPIWVYNKDVGREANVIIYESTHFFVVSEWGAMIKGFLMICPKEHILSMACMPDGYFAEYFQVEHDIEFILKGTYGYDKAVSFFEHGSNPSGKSSHKRSVVHAHTHVVWGFEFKQKYLDMVMMRPCEDIREAKSGKYFSYRKNADGQIMIVTDPTVYVQRQYPRQIIAEEQGLAPGQYNWRKEGFEENVTATLYRMHRYLSENYDDLPERIRIATDGFVKGYALRDGYRKA